MADGGQPGHCQIAIVYGLRNKIRASEIGIAVRTASMGILLGDSTESAAFQFRPESRSNSGQDFQVEIKSVGNHCRPTIFYWQVLP